ncbi:MAG: hypothetical protein H0T78_00145 [Longispora sp.]|nr:hypothetical protein [Longispora sp. (in: high G+C Gram-positive bacteria)]
MAKEPDPTPDPTSDHPRCSAKGCGLAARWAVIWRNPKVHTPDRRKIWTACDHHRPSLSQFLDSRGFLLDVEPLDTVD